MCNGYANKKQNEKNKDELNDEYDSKPIKMKEVRRRRFDNVENVNIVVKHLLDDAFAVTV